MSEISKKTLSEEKIKSLFFSFGERERGEKEIFVTDVIYCWRRAWFTYKFKSKLPPSPKMVLGKLIHSSLPFVFDGYYANYEVPVSHELKDGWILTGKADMVLDDVVYEFKFTHDSFNRVSPAYFVQVEAYISMLNKSIGYLVLVDRNTFDVKMIRIERDDKIFDAFIKEAEELIDVFRGDELPFVNSPRHEFECKHCPLFSVCKHLGVRSEGPLQQSS
jgi:CRISPR/Cas system-associated exonuclease Cas4 (RecB family)